MLAYRPWRQMSDDEKSDLIRHLKILCFRNKLPSRIIVFVRDVCIPVLEEGDGIINEHMDFVQLAESRGFRISEISSIVGRYHEELHLWVNTKKAAHIMDRSERQVRRLAKKGIPHLEAKLTKRGWLINPVSINDWWLRNNPHENL